MVDEAVYDCCCHVVVSKDGSPAGELEVGGDDEATFFVAVSDDLDSRRAPSVSMGR